MLANLVERSNLSAAAGEVNTGKVSLCVSDGALLVPSEVRCALCGGRVELAGGAWSA